MLAQRLMWIAWPAFMVAGALEMVVFALIDPEELHWLGQPLELSRQTIYTLTFFFFWGVTFVSSAITTLLSMSPFEINRCPVPFGKRPEDCARHAPMSH